MADHSTIVQSLQAGVARQMEVLSDPDLTGTGLSSAELLGVPAATMAEKLTGHLLREIIIRGTGGGPLSSLANQLNHDVSHMKGQQIEGMVERLSSQVLEAFTELKDSYRLANEQTHIRPAGQLITEVTDPFALEIHRPITVASESAVGTLPLLPPYIRREHDTRLTSLVTQTAAGSSVIGVLVGGSSTGKTRACWEAIQALPPGWRLWHPIFPDRGNGFLAELELVGPNTVVWLNEAQLYLLTSDPAVGEQVVGGLRKLLRDPARGPVLVLGTIWRSYWDQLTRPSEGAPDPHAGARMLLEGSAIEVPDRFNDSELTALSASATKDPRLAEAAAQAADGEVTQFLAGAPALLERYRTSSPAARTVIHSAMDARRLGHGPVLPYTLLQAAAPGYLTDQQWEQAGEDWFEEALNYTAAPCNGVRGPVVPIRPRPGSRARHVGGPVSRPDVANGQQYRLSDYLEQHARRDRNDQLPPVTFWDALATCANAEYLPALADEAEARGLYRHASILRKRAVAIGHRSAGDALIQAVSAIDPDATADVAQWIAAQDGLTDPQVVVSVLKAVCRTGDSATAARIAVRAAAQVELANPPAMPESALLVFFPERQPIPALLTALRDAGGTDALAALAASPSAYIKVTDPYTLADMLTAVREAGGGDSLTDFADHAASHADLAHAGPIGRLLKALWDADAEEAAAALLARDPGAHADPTDLYGLRYLLEVLREAGAQDALVALANRAAAHADPGGYGLRELLQALREAGAQDAVATLAGRAAVAIDLEHPHPAATLLALLRDIDAQDAIAALANRAVACSGLTNPSAFAARLMVTHMVGTQDALAVLADQAAEHADLTCRTELPEDEGIIEVPLRYPVDELLNVLREAGTEHALAVLMARDPAAQADLTNPYAVAALLKELRDVGADKALAALADRAAGQADLAWYDAVTTLLAALEDVGAAHSVAVLANRAVTMTEITSPYSVTSLLNVLRKAGAREAVAALLARDPAAHADLTHPSFVAYLLRALLEAGADEAVAALANRASALVPLTRPGDVATLLEALREARAGEAVAALLARDPAGHVNIVARLRPSLNDTYFDEIFPLAEELAQVNAIDAADRLITRAADGGCWITLCETNPEWVQETFPFGREPGGEPSPQWGWRDIA